MSDYGFADHLGQLTMLTANERTALLRLEERERSVRRGAALVRENEANTELFVVRRGMMASMVLLPDGSRQILRFLFPGDVAVAALLYARSPETIMASTDCVVSLVDRSALAAVLIAHPRLAALTLAIGQSIQRSLSGRIAALGRLSARARIAALLLELRDGMRRADPAVGSAFSLPVTQEDIGDATGLTAVHVNRMLRQLEEQRMIVREAGRVRLLDETSLAALANRPDRHATIDLGWLPPPSLGT